MLEKTPAKQEENRDTRFKKGQSGNPTGRPKGSVSITARLRKILMDENEAEDLARAILKEAKDGNASVIKEILNRLEGAVVQSVAMNVKTEADLSGITTEELAAIEEILERNNPDS